MNGDTMSKQLYISNDNINNNQTPEYGYDPRYYYLGYRDEMGYWHDEPDPEVIDYIDDRFGNDSYQVVMGGTIYTEDCDVMMFLQEETLYGTPERYDGRHVDKELRDDGWTW